MAAEKPARALTTRSFLFSCFACVCLILFETTGARAADAPTLEYPIKATFLEKFGDFVTWPADLPAAPTFNICIFGEDPFGGLIDQTMRGQALGSRPINLMRLRHIDEATQCQILYFGKSAQPPTGAMLAGLSGKPILTVTDAVSWTGEPLGMIHFVVKDNRVRFVIDDAAAAAAHLAISSKLLGVALAVNPRPKAGAP
ncbi:MAG: YfiR family protein [Rhodospirillaceae bacterium]